MKGLSVETAAVGGVCKKFLRIFKVHSSIPVSSHSRQD